MKVGVLMGGMSSEREVSLNTGKEIVKNLDKNKYEVEPIVIGKGEDIPNKVKGIDIAFLALHGKFGEDGIIQGMLESLGIPYTGCGILSSSIGIDKDMTKRIIRCAKVKTPDWIMVKDAKNINFAKIEEIGYPVVVKPNCGGSSIATSLVKCKDDIVEAVEEALKYDKEVMIEKYIKGDEITCCILN
ncbi:MAG TPA: D-alanine--D-alanine ligase, partial [Clostridiaceae bacterium]|nr:D-alanine--D-alanine ligase [Clostridiaceae bacterium]